MTQRYKIFLICFLIFGIFVLFANVLNMIYGFDININVEPHEKGSKGEKGSKSAATGEQDMQYPPDYVLPNGSGWIDGKTNKYIKWNFSD